MDGESLSTWGLREGAQRSSLSPALDHKDRFRDVSVDDRGGACLGAWEVAPGSCPPLPFYLVLFPSCCRNAEKILGYLHNNVLSRDLIPPHVNFSHLTTKDYTEMYKVIMTVKEDRFSALGLDPCLLEDELNKVRDRLEGRHRSGDPETSHGWLEAPESCQGLIHLLDKQGLHASREERGKVSVQSPALRSVEYWGGEKRTQESRKSQGADGTTSTLIEWVSCTPVAAMCHALRTVPGLWHTEHSVYFSPCPLLSVSFGLRDSTVGEYYHCPDLQMSSL